MNPRENSVNIADVKLYQVLKLMYETYNKRHKTSAQIGSYKFIPEKFVEENHATLATLINEQRTLSGLSSYSDKQLMKAVFNGMARNNFLERDRCMYYFSEMGYKQALKSSNKLKYWNKYHTGTFWGIIIAIISSPILGWISFGE
ncbi:hypothetical protein OAY_06770 [Vibrio cyclitrophicus ZF205]|uniref:hypothetical protein n=1 Tax=Vibrio TaxID=662 RepID=UPI0002E3E237|nr:hypothetical protein [Vibrio cyclitrophicus]OEE14484.1 hypothetical protein OAY_06770 [Vibrio cyclitrophicus ZF205]